MRLKARFWRIIAPRTLNAAAIPMPSIEPSRHDQSLQGRRSRELEFLGRKGQGTIIRVHMRDVEHKGYTHHANPDVPQYEVKSAKTDHIAFHKGSALTKLRD